MPYDERVGQSKLSVVWDGLRFLLTILFSFCCYSPIKSALAACLVVVLLGGSLVAALAWAGSSPAFLASLGGAFSLLGVLLVWAGVIGHQLNYLLIGPRRVLRPTERALQRLLHERGLMTLGAATTILGGLGFGWLGLRASAMTATMTALASGSLTLLMAAGMAALTCGVVSRVIWAVNEKQRSSVRHDHALSGAGESRDPVQPGFGRELLQRQVPVEG